MSDFFHSFRSDDLLLLIVVVSGMAIFLVIAIGAFVVAVIKSNNQTKLKQEMLARGMSAEEIKTVLETGSKPPAIKIDWKK
jgi:hypothetical protein